MHLSHCRAELQLCGRHTMPGVSLWAASIAASQPGCGAQSLSRKQMMSAPRSLAMLMPALPALAGPLFSFRRTPVICMQKATAFAAAIQGWQSLRECAQAQHRTPCPDLRSPCCRG